MTDINPFAVFLDPEYRAGWFPGLMVMILSGYVAAPAIASIVLVEVAKRWSLLQRSMLASAAAATVATFVIGGIWIDAIASLAEDYSQHKTLYRTLPYLALTALAVAIWFQYRNRATFSRVRGVGITCAVLLPVILLIVGGAT